MISCLPQCGRPRKGTGQDLTVLDALILGVVQGFTEFLPVSSSGHLVLVPEFFNIPAPTLAFDVLVHVATLVAVLGYFIRDVGKIVLSVVAPRRMSRQEVKYWRRLLRLAGDRLHPRGIRRLSSLRLLREPVRQHSRGGRVPGRDQPASLGRRLRSWPGQAASRHRLDKMRAADALVVGCFQALAIAPGLSRSGSTIAAGVFLGFDRPTAARFSFLLSIPVILGAFLFKLKDIGGAFAGTSGPAYAVGAIAAAISGFMAVYFLMRYLEGAPAAGLRRLHGPSRRVRDRAVGGVGRGMPGRSKTAEGSRAAVRRWFRRWSAAFMAASVMLLLLDRGGLGRFGLGGLPGLERAQADRPDLRRQHQGRPGSGHAAGAPEERGPGHAVPHRAPGGRHALPSTPRSSRA